MRALIDAGAPKHSRPARRSPRRAGPAVRRGRGRLFGRRGGPSSRASGLSNPSLSGILKQGGRVISPSGRRLRDALVIIEVGGATVLLITAGLLLGSFARLTRVDPGIQTDRVFVAGYYLPSQTYPTEEDRALFMKRLMAGVSTIQGVDASGLIDWLPFSGDEFRQAFDVESRGASPHWRTAARQSPLCLARILSDARSTRCIVGDCSTNMTPPAGRPSSSSTKRMARRYFPNAEPIGRRINLERARAGTDLARGRRRCRRCQAGPSRRSAVSRHLSSRRTKPGGVLLAVIRSSIDQATLGSRFAAPPGPSIRTSPSAPSAPIRQLIATSFAAERLYSTLLGVSSVVALLLAAGGVFAVMSHAVAQRTHEVGIRLALGATPSQIRVAHPGLCGAAHHRRAPDRNRRGHHRGANDLDAAVRCRPRRRDSVPRRAGAVAAGCADRDVWARPKGGDYRSCRMATTMVGGTLSEHTCRKGTPTATH